MPKEPIPPSSEYLSVRDDQSGLPELSVIKLPRSMAMLRALQLMYPKLPEDRLMKLAERNMALSERDASLASRKVGVPLFSAFSLGFSIFLAMSLQTFPTEPNIPAIVFPALFTSFCLFMTAFFLGAPRAAIAFFANKAKETAVAHVEKDGNE